MGIGRKDIAVQKFSSQDIINKDITSQDTEIIYYCDFSDSNSLKSPIILGAMIRQLLEGITISADLEQQINPLCRPGARPLTDNFGGSTPCPAAARPLRRSQVRSRATRFPYPRGSPGRVAQVSCIADFQSAALRRFRRAECISSSAGWKPCDTAG